MQQMEYLLEEIENFKEKLQGKDGQLEDFMTMTQMEQRQGKASGNGNEKDIQKDTDDTVAIAESFYLSVDEGEGVASISNFPRDFRLNSDEEEEESDESGMLTRSLTRGEEMQLRRMKRAERQRELEGWKAKWEEFEKLRREAKAAQEERESNGGILFFSTRYAHQFPYSVQNVFPDIKTYFASGDVGDAAHIERLESELEQWMHASEQIQKLGEEAVLEVFPPPLPPATAHSDSPTNGLER